MYRLYTISITCALVICSSFQIYAKEPQKEVNSWRGQLSNDMGFLHKAANDKSDPHADIHRDHIERYNVIFASNKINHIVITEKLALGETISTTDIYYQDGLMHILHRKYSHKSRMKIWNMFSTKDYVYEWEDGSNTGIKIKKNEKELYRYLMYLIGHGGWLHSLYKKYKQSPQDYIRINNENDRWFEIAGKNPKYGIEAIFIGKNPFWLYGMRFKQYYGTYTTTISRPISEAALPNKLTEAFNNISFIDSKLSVRRHIVYP